ncbi:DUF4397 domain-containing protein [Mucilaginibacter sp. X4EP1]|uniref:DUF4397 domain-containing protein n=1 Tax=Mucilaginibacter sp. X4EP1 TaxID=2723092 RepID=UPI0021685663|nr:DUF4397 domain-containing protein [Mucilaginibacter sp. X4EP1]MCS3815905.1 hypothetical protein [Mucilaginibacter sp. X4EP1]
MNTRFSVLLIVAALTVLYSCKNNDEVFKTVPSSFLNVVNGSADTLNFYLNGTRQNNTSSLYPSGQSFYISVPSGTQNYQFKKAGNSTVLFSTPLTLVDSVNYSMYVYGEASGSTFYTRDTLQTFTAYPDTTQVRFVNISPDAGNLDVYVGSALSFTTRAFKSSSAFSLFPGGATEVKVYQSGSSTLKIDTTITFNAGGIFTIFSKGLLNGKGTAAFNIGVAQNH